MFGFENLEFRWLGDLALDVIQTLIWLVSLIGFVAAIGAVWYALQIALGYSA